MDENRPKAKTLLERAIARDPNFVLAYCLLSVVQATPNWAEELTPDEIAQAKATAEKAFLSFFGVVDGALYFDS